MIERKSLSNARSLYTRKYFLSISYIVIASLLLLKSSGLFIFFAVLLLAIGVFYLFLRKVEFDDEFVYIGTKKYTFNQLTKLSSIDVNLYVFPYLEINDNGRKRRIVTDSGQAGIFRILIGAVVPALDPLKNVKRFKELFDASR